MEIDLLRGGEHATAVPLDDARAACEDFDYHDSVHRFDDLETFFVYPIRLEDCLPTTAVPLLPGDAPVPLDLQAVFDRCYDAGPQCLRGRLRRRSPDPTPATLAGGVGRGDRPRTITAGMP